MGLKLRIMLAFSGVLALVMLVGATYFVRGAREDVRTELQSTLQLTVHFLDTELARFASAAAAGENILFHLDRLQQIRHLRVEYFDSRGRLLESNQAPGTSRREAPPGWFMTLAAPPTTDLQVVRRPVVIGAEPRGELVISPDPVNEVGEIWQDTKDLVELSLALFVTVNAVMYWVVLRAFRPMNRILAALDEMRRGKLETRMPPFALPELRQISAEFNRMADTLEQSAEQNRRLTRQMIQLQEQEQRRLARELHDELGQCLSAIHADAVAILRHGQATYPPVRESAAAIVEVTRRILATVRAMLQRLRPETLDALGLPVALQELVSAWRQHHADVRCELQLHGDFRSLGEEVNITVFRIVQETLTNVAKHARAANVHIVLARAEAAVVLQVSDDGVGTNDHCGGRGFGLLGIRERVIALGGELAIETQPGQGYRLKAELPLTAMAV